MNGRQFSDVDPDVLRDWVQRSCDEQQLNLRVTDLVAVGRVSVLLMGKAARRLPTA